jgi:hypothetical protein
MDIDMTLDTKWLCHINFDNPGLQVNLINV